MNEADILASTYEDSVTVYRAFKDVLPNGESVFKSGIDGEIVYQDKECALSTQTGGKLEQSSCKRSQLQWRNGNFIWRGRLGTDECLQGNWKL